MDTNKINQLYKASKDKSLTREERRQASYDYAWEKYRLDKRPPMTFRKSSFYNAVLSLTIALMFGYMGLAEQFDFKSSSLSLMIFPFFLVAEIAALVFSLRQQSKYKTEPADDLATSNMNRAGVLSYAAIISVMAVTMLVVSILNDGDRFSVSYSAMMFLFCGFVNLQSCIQKFIFLFIERGDTVEAEEDE